MSLDVSGNISEHCSVIYTTAHASHEDVHRAISEGWNRGWSLPEIRPMTTLWLTVSPVQSLMVGITAPRACVFE